MQAADRLQIGLEEEPHIWPPPGFKKTGKKLHVCNWQEKGHENQIPSVVLSKTNKKKPPLCLTQPTELPLSQHSVFDHDFN